jgi:hypothetical protein
VQAWHWNPKGTWSDPSGKAYFIGDANPTEFIRHSYGYALQHRRHRRGRAAAWVEDVERRTLCAIS